MTSPRSISPSAPAGKLSNPWPDDPDYASCLSNVSNGLQSRFERLSNVADLENALAAGVVAVHAAAPGDPDRGMYLANLANSMQLRFGLRGDPADIDQAIRLLTWRGLGRRDRERWLSEWNGLASGAAVSNIAADRPADAAASLEHGRAVLWSQMLDARTAMTALQEADPPLAGRLDTVRARLNALDEMQRDRAWIGYRDPTHARLRTSGEIDQVRVVVARVGRRTGVVDDVGDRADAAQ